MRNEDDYIFKLYENHGKLCYRHQYLTLREMKFAVNLFHCGFNKTAAAVMAGYSPKSARYRAYHLTHKVSFFVYWKWYQEQVDFIGRFPKADILLPDDDDLKAWLAKYGVRVWDADLIAMKYYHPAYNFDAMDSGTRHLMHLCVYGSDTYKKNGKIIKETCEPYR